MAGNNRERANRVSRLDGYLTTAPGGLPAATAETIGSGASVGLIITMPLVRIFAALGAGSLVGTYLRRRAATNLADSDSHE